MKANQQNGRTLLLPMIATVMVSLTALAYPTYLRPRLFLLALSHPSDTRILVDYMYEERIAGEIVLQILEKEDWSRGKIAAGPRVDAFDFPAYAIRMVPNDAPTAQRLAKLLAANPYQRLARGAALRLGRFKQYEAAPILLRFALFEGDEACLEGLKAMGIPQAFWAGEMGAGSTLEDLHALPRGHFPRIPAAVCDEMDTIVERYVKSSEASRNKM